MKKPFNALDKKQLDNDVGIDEVALIGKGPGFELAPLYGSGVITWGVNDLVGHRRCDVCFWLDKQYYNDSEMDRIIVESVNSNNTPMYSTQKWDDVPTSLEYPKDEIIKYFGIDYFGDSCSYMIALAVYQGFKKLSLYGFNYAWGSNFVHEKPCVEFWLGRALERGCTISIDKKSKLLKSRFGHIYAFRDPEFILRENLKSHGSVPDFDEREYTFSIGNRVTLMHMLPKVGNYNILKASKDLHSKLWFKDSEAEVINLRQVEGENGVPYFLWDDNGLEDVNVSMTPIQQRMIYLILSKISEKNQLNESMFELYEMFCLGK